MILVKILIFVLATAGLLFISRASLRAPRSHGFHRFFAWETMLIFFLLNVTYWFENPFAWYQWISWTLLFLCILPAIWGMILLGKHGNPVKKRALDSGLLGFEKTTSLVTSGIYRYIRHPLYSSLFLLTWGIFFKYPSWAGGALAAVATAFLFLTAQADEAECVSFFGAVYVEYMKKTKRFIPFLF
jgi:protein-S-isoprenylcysteine O-methyltransferase Ste14